MYSHICIQTHTNILRHTYTHTTYTHARTNIHTQITHSSIYRRAQRTDGHTCPYPSTHTHAHTPTHTHTHTHTHNTHTYAHTHTCRHTHTQHTHTHTHTSARTNTHTQITQAYTGCPKNNGTVNFQDFALINSYLFSPCWIEHLFLFIITPRSFNLVKKFLFYEYFLMDCHFRALPLSFHWWVALKIWNSRFFLGLCSDQQLSFLPAWIEHLFLIIITPRSSNLVENFLFYE